MSFRVYFQVVIGGQLQTKNKKKRTFPLLKHSQKEKTRENPQNEDDFKKFWTASDCNFRFNIYDSAEADENAAKSNSR
jgi:hypothetical protein